MKKLSLAIILIAICAMAMAQPRAIGGRIGWSIGPSYQHQIGEKTMIQADVDLLAYGFWGVQGTVTFNWIIPLVSVNAGNLNLYPGVGIGGGYEWWKSLKGNIPYDWYPYPYGRSGNGFIGIAGMIGIEWNFKFPLQLSFEYRPLIGVELYNRPRYAGSNDYMTYLNLPYKNGFWESALALCVRYKFGGK